MIKFFKLILILFLLISFSNIANSLTSSSYLITNEAILSFDYETASKYYDKDHLADSSVNELRKKIISLINSNKLKQTKRIAEQAVELDEIREDAWLVLLSIAKLNNDSNTFKKFSTLKNENNFEIIDYVFYNNGLFNKNNEDVAKNLFDIIQSIEISEILYNKNIDYYLFYLNLALNFNPNFNEALFVQAQIYQELQYFIKAESIYRKISSQHPLYIDAQKNIVLIKKKVNKFKEAENLLLALINEYPENDSLLVLLADIYRGDKQYEKSIKFYTLVINKNINGENQWRLHFLRGISYERLNRWKKAEEDLLKALEFNPEQPQVLNYLAYGWIEKNFHLNKSIQMLELAINKNPKSHYILDSLAWAYYKKNNLIKALNIMEKVIEIAPGEAISLDHLGDIYFSLGRKKEAYFMWLQALDLAEPEDNISESVQIKIDKYNAG